MARKGLPNQPVTLEIICTPLTPVPEDAQILAFQTKGIRPQRTMANMLSILEARYRTCTSWQFPISAIVDAEYVTADLKTRTDPFVRVTARIASAPGELKRAA